MAIPDTYGSPGSPAIASYNFIDIASGTGYVTYYAGNEDISGATLLSGGTYMLSNQVFYSDIIALRSDQVTIGLDENHKFIDANFDIKFNIPQTLRGDAIITIPVAVDTGVTGGAFAVWPEMTLQRVSNGVATNIVTKTGGIWFEQNATPGVFMELFTTKLAVPLTHFKSNDSLRLNVVIYAKREGVADLTTSRVFLCCDPQGRTGAEKPTSNAASVVTFTSGKITILTAQIPFKIDL